MSGPEPAAVDDDDDRRLLVDDIAEKLERIRLLRGRDEAAADSLMAELGASGSIDRQIVTELAAPRSLLRPERFSEAHQRALHSLEVLERNGARPVAAPRRLGPIGAVVSFTSGLVCRFIVRNHQRELIDRVGHTYDRRLAWMPADDAHRMRLLRASLDVRRVASAYRGNPVGLPTFLLGGAAVSGLGGAARAVLDAALSNQAATLAAGVVVFGLFTLMAWSILRGAATAGHRIGLTTEQPMAALWQTVGWAGRPPKDPSRDIAVAGIALTALAWLVLPAAFAFVIARI